MASPRHSGTFQSFTFILNKRYVCYVCCESQGLSRYLGHDFTYWNEPILSEHTYYAFLLHMGFRQLSALTQDSYKAMDSRSYMQLCFGALT